MRHLFIFFIITFFVIILVSCGRTAEQPVIIEQFQESSDILIAYFSHTGNTRSVAVYLQSFVGGDLFEIVAAEPYPTAFDACLSRARTELENRILPELEFYLDYLEDYSTVFIGFPVWLSSAPMIVLSFLESHDFSGVTVIPFTTRGRGEIGQSVDMIRNVLPDSDVLEGFHGINRENFDRAFSLVKEWVHNNVIE